MIQNLVLQTPSILLRRLPFLIDGGPVQRVDLTQLQCACVLANMFLCTFPASQGGAIGAAKKVFPSISFAKLLTGSGGFITPANSAKLDCVLHYFDRVGDLVARREPGSIVSFERFRLAEPMKWEELNSTRFQPCDVIDDGAIEDASRHFAHVDFANKLVGGGVLGNGCIQEEIRFVCSPELIVSRLLCSELLDDEVVVVTGAATYSLCKGYSTTFRFVGDCPSEKKVLLDAQGRRVSQVLVMDALFFGSSLKSRMQQFKKANVDRELNKAYVGFSCVSYSPVSTGNWGCGNFGGYHDLKAIIQLMAAAAAGKALEYYTFQVKGVAEKIKSLHKELVANRIGVTAVYNCLMKLGENCENATAPPDVFAFIKEELKL